jgi:hypothetical protein
MYDKSKKIYKEKVAPQISVWLAIHFSVIVNFLPYLIYGTISIVMYFNFFDNNVLECMMKTPGNKPLVEPPVSILVEPKVTILAERESNAPDISSKDESTGKNESINSAEKRAADKEEWQASRARDKEYLNQLKREEEALREKYNLRHAEIAAERAAHNIPGEGIKTGLSNVVNNDHENISERNASSSSTIREKNTYNSTISESNGSSSHISENKGPGKRTLEEYVLAAEESRKDVLSELKKREESAGWFNWSWNWFGIDLNRYGLGFVKNFTTLEKILFVIGVYTACVIVVTLLPGLIGKFISWFTNMVKNSTILFGNALKEAVIPTPTVAEHIVAGVKQIPTVNKILTKKLAEDGAAAAAARGVGMFGYPAMGVGIGVGILWILKHLRK